MKNGKLFGKLNIIDLLIILIVIAAVIFVGVRFLGEDDTSSLGGIGTQKVRVTFSEPAAPILLADYADGSQLGKPVYNHDKSAALGVLTSFEAEENYTYEWDPHTGELIKVPSTLYCQLQFSCETEGSITDEGLFVNGIHYSIGSSWTIRAGQMRIYCRVAGFEPVD